MNESADKIRVETKVKIKGDDAEEVVEKLNNTVELLQDTGNTLRALQPEADE